jgi:sugar phosphate isomerase/epimerase
MPVYVSTICLRNGRDVFEVLKAYAQVGLANVELGSFSKYTGDLIVERFTHPSNFNFVVHHYFPPPQKPFIVNLASQDPTILRQSREHIRRALDFCADLGITLFSFHAGFRADPDEQLVFPERHLATPYETAFNTFIDSVEEINRYAEAKGVRIAIENNVLAQHNVVDGQNPFLLLCEAREFEALWQRVHSTNIGILLDLGHLKVTSNWLSFDKYEFVDRVRDRVFAIHMHENNGLVDEHKPLDETSWCFDIISENNFANLPIVLECNHLTLGQILQQVTLIKRFVERGKS